MWRRASRVAKITPQEAAALVADETAVLIDVRTVQEWSEGHAEGAVHVPLDTVPGALPDLDASRDGRTLAFICRSGQAARFAAGAGIEVANVAGGTLAWQRAGLPMSRG